MAPATTISTPEKIIYLPVSADIVIRYELTLVASTADTLLEFPVLVH
jgi:hypothetical protein